MEAATDTGDVASAGQSMLIATKALSKIPPQIKKVLAKASGDVRVQLAVFALGVALVLAALGGGIYGIVYAAEHGKSPPPPAADNNHQPDPSTAQAPAGGTSLSGSPLAPTSAYPFVTFHAGTLNCDAAAWTWISRHNQLPPTDPAYIDPRKWVWVKGSSTWYSQGGTSYVVLKYAGADPTEYEAVQQKAATAFVGCAGDPSSICLTNLRQNPCVP